MTALCFLLLGVCLALGGILVWVAYADQADRRQPSVETLAWIEQLRAQQRLIELTQRTVRQMLRVIREHQS